MKKVTDWLEFLIDNLYQRKHWSYALVMVLLVLFIGAGSLYMLLNSEA